MGKRTTTLYVDDDLVELAKVKRINLSSFFNKTLSAEFDIKDGADEIPKIDMINKLKARVGMLSMELEKERKIKDKLEKKNNELKLKNAKLERRFNARFIEIAD